MGEIQNNSDPAQWRHILGEVNVADDVSCRIPVQSLSGRWKHGPEFLSLREQDWPQSTTVAPETKETDKERRNPQNVCTITTIHDAINPKGFSNWRKLVRVAARIQRLGTRARTKKEKVNEDTSVSEKKPLTRAQGRARLNTGKVNKKTTASEGDTLMPTKLEQAAKFWINEAQKPSMIE